MNKTAFYIISIFILLFLCSQQSIATSGTCSSHGGVNCSAGPDLDDGSPICNDGWKDSTEMFYDSLECKNRDKPNEIDCLFWEVYEIKLPELEVQLEEARDAYREYLTTADPDIVGKGYSPSQIEAIKAPKISLLKSTISAYEALILKIKPKWFSEFTYEFYCSSEAEAVTTQCPLNSTLGTDGKCNCNAGFWVLNNECVTKNNWCTGTYGSSSKYNSSSDNCTCITGYEWNTGYTACIKKAQTEDVQVNMVNFTDVSDNYKFKNAINFVKENSIVNGYDDGTYKPANEINRAEFTKIFTNAAFGESAASYANVSCFNDVENSAWFASYVCYAKDNNIIEGYGNNIFKPANNINVAEALKITLETFFDNIQTVDGVWYQKYWNYAQEHNLLLDEWTNPANYITRGEMAELIYRIKN